MQGYTYIFIHTHCVYVSVCVYEIHDRKENSWSWGKKVWSWFELTNEPILCTCAPSLCLRINVITLENLPLHLGEILPHLSRFSSSVGFSLKPPLISCFLPQKMCPLMCLWNGGGNQCWNAIDCWRHWDGSKLAEGIRSLHSELVLIVITTTPVDSHYQTKLGNSDPVSSTQFIEETTEVQIGNWLV